MADSVLGKEIKNTKFEKATEPLNAIVSGSKTSSHDYMMKSARKFKSATK
ncbi:hypothetical protein QTN79_01535 [Candidatus Saccharibacteria bacterium oral taxon 488]